MQKINIRKIYYHIRHRYITMNNVVITVALLIGAGWAWGSIGVMQRNYGLQREVDSKMQQQQLADLEVQNAQYEQRYYQSSEYQELAVRNDLGLANPGEKVLILPPNSQAAKNADITLTKNVTKPIALANDFQQWMNFLFGGNRQHLQK
jgi:hypothetical protein